MPIKGQSTWAYYFAEDVVNGGGKTGDVANHTLRRAFDNSVGTIAGSPSEVDPTNFKGLYRVQLTSGENSGDVMAVGGISSTTGIVLRPLAWTNIHNVAAWLGTAPAALADTNKVQVSVQHFAALMLQAMRDAMKLARSAGAPATDSIDELIERTLDAVEGLDVGSGAGAFTIVITVEKTDQTEVPDCDVIVTADDAETSSDEVVASGKTNGSGEVTFQLDEGVYRMWRQKSGINFTNPLTLTVDENGDATIE